MPAFTPISAQYRHVAAQVLAEIEATPVDTRYNQHRLGKWLRAVGLPTQGYFSNNRAAEALMHLVFALGSAFGADKVIGPAPDPVETRLVETLVEDAVKIDVPADIAALSWHDLRRKANELGVENVRQLDRAGIEAAIMEALTKP